MQKREDLGEPEIQWTRCLYLFAKAEFCDLFHELISTKSIALDGERIEYKLELFLQMSVNLSLNKKNELVNIYLEKFKKGLRQYLKDSFGGFNSSTLITANLSSETNPTLNMSFNGSQNFYSYVKKYYDYSSSRLEISSSKENDITKIVKKLKLCHEYFNLFTNENKNKFDDKLNMYIETRTKYLTDLDNCLEEFELNNARRELDPIKTKMAKLRKKLEIDGTSEAQDTPLIQKFINEIEYGILLNIINKLLEN